MSLKITNEHLFSHSIKGFTFPAATSSEIIFFVLIARTASLKTMGTFLVHYPSVTNNV